MNLKLLFTTKKIIFVIAGAIIVGGIIAAAVILTQDNDENEQEDVKKFRGAVVTNGQACAKIGVDILRKGGSAVDSAIASLFCEGVSMPQTMGLGGGFFMMIYEQKTGKVVALNSREVAPAAATEDMFHKNHNVSERGPLSIAVPGELRGYWQAHEKYGKLPWAELIKPTIELARSGIEVTEYLESVFVEKKDLIKRDPLLKEYFWDDESDDVIKTGKKYKMERLAKTLEIICEEKDALNDGSLTESLAKDIQNTKDIFTGENGIITADDLRNYQPKWTTDLKGFNLNDGKTLFSIPVPGSGIVLGFMLNVIKDMLDYDTEYEDVNNVHILIESMKHAYGRRTELGDNITDYVQDLIRDMQGNKEFIQEIQQNITLRMDATSQNPEDYGAAASLVEDHGTAHINVLAPNGDAVAVTSTINFKFGSAVGSLSTGIILNDEMDDFSSPGMENGFDLPPSPSNFIAPGKTPMSSMCPTIIVDEKRKKPRLITGGAGGSKITSSVAQLIVKHLWFGYNVSEAIQDRRFHHQLFPMSLTAENEYKSTDLMAGLAKKGHVITYEQANGFSALTGIACDDDGITTASSDRRRNGAIEYL